MTITTTDHAVPHISKLPINSGQTVNLFVRERDGTRPGGDRTAVLMLHGRSIPVLPSADLGTGKYNWMLSLARAGFDVFAIEHPPVRRRLINSPRMSAWNALVIMIVSVARRGTGTGRGSRICGQGQPPRTRPKARLRSPLALQAASLIAQQAWPAVISASPPRTVAGR